MRSMEVVPVCDEAPDADVAERCDWYGVWDNVECEGHTGAYIYTPRCFGCSLVYKTRRQLADWTKRITTDSTSGRLPFIIRDYH